MFYILLPIQKLGSKSIFLLRTRWLINLSTFFSFWHQIIDNLLEYSENKEILDDKSGIEILVVRYGKW